MAQTQTSCPRCRRPLVADIEQVFDAGVDSQAKQKILSGSFNVGRCQSCGFEGVISTPLIYHDPDKELLLTYFPPDIGLPVTEQERLIGPMVKKVFDKLPAEKRKAYLLRPQTMLTIQTMIDRILEADGITRAMVESQQKQINLIQRLVSATPESRTEIIKNELGIINEAFFVLLSRLSEIAGAQGDEGTSRQLASLQDQLMKETDAGREIKVQVDEVQAAIKSLQEASQKGMTREKLLELILSAPTEVRLNTLVQMAYKGFDYVFFQMLTEQIDQSSGDEKTRLSGIRDNIGVAIRNIEKALQEQTNQTKQLLEKIINAPNIEEAFQKNSEHITQLFMDVLQSELQTARKDGNLDRGAKLQQLMAILEKASAPPPEFALVEELLQAEDEAQRIEILKSHSSEVTPELLQMITSLIQQTEKQGQQPEIIPALKSVYRTALKFSMQANLAK